VLACRLEREFVDGEKRHGHSQHADDQKIKLATGPGGSRPAPVGARSLFSPCGVSSNAQASNSASGKPTMSNTMTSVTDHSGNEKRDISL